MSTDPSSTDPSSTEEHRAGFVTILGRPNVGKSTLLNTILGQKIAIVTPKPQTTRDRIIGICPVDNGQLIFVDTPGVHLGGNALNRHLQQVATNSIADVDAILFVIDAKAANGKLSFGDRAVMELAMSASKPVVGVLNKVDIAGKAQLLPLMASLLEAGQFETLVPVSAVTSDGLDIVLDTLRGLMPIGPALYDPEELTDQPTRFIVAEMLREKLMLDLGQELPYSLAIEITRFKERENGKMVDIDATIHVERKSQKGIVLGRGGERLKDAATAARIDMEALLGQRVFLHTHVRVEANWTKSEKGLRKLGYAPRRDK
jgi:GTP-binding protein Era